MVVVMMAMRQRARRRGLGLLPLRSQGFPRSAYELVVPRLPGTPGQQSRGSRPRACAEGGRHVNTSGALEYGGGVPCW